MEQKFKVGDIVKGIANDIKGYIMRVEEITSEGYTYLSLVAKGDGRWDWNEMINVKNGILKRKISWYDSLELIPQPLTNTIITDIKDKEQHKRVQEKLFGMGNYWGMSGKKILDEMSNHISINKDTTLSYAGNDYTESNTYLSGNYKLITAAEFLGEEENVALGVDYSYLVGGDSTTTTMAPSIPMTGGGGSGISIVDNPFKKCWPYEEYNKRDLSKPQVTEIINNNKIMENIVSFFNDLTVSQEDKELRKAGLKDNNLNWSFDSRSIVADLEAKERGYKDFDKLSYGFSGDSELTTLELDTLYTKFYSKLLETAKKFNRRDEKKTKK